MPGDPHTITIPVNDNDYIVGFSPRAAETLEEGGAPVEIAVTTNAPVPVPITLNVAAGGAGARGTDYTILGLPLTILTGKFEQRDYTDEHE